MVERSDSDLGDLASKRYSLAAALIEAASRGGCDGGVCGWSGGDQLLIHPYTCPPIQTVNILCRYSFSNIIFDTIVRPLPRSSNSSIHRLSLIHFPTPQRKYAVQGSPLCLRGIRRRCTIRHFVCRHIDWDFNMRRTDVRMPPRAVL